MSGICQSIAARTTRGIGPDPEPFSRSQPRTETCMGFDRKERPNASALFSDCRCRQRLLAGSPTSDDGSPRPVGWETHGGAWSDYGDRRGNATGPCDQQSSVRDEERELLGPKRSADPVGAHSACVCGPRQVRVQVTSRPAVIVAVPAIVRSRYIPAGASEFQMSLTQSHEPSS